MTSESKRLYEQLEEEKRAHDKTRAELERVKRVMEFFDTCTPAERKVIETAKAFWKARAATQELPDDAPRDNPVWARFDGARVAFYASIESLEEKL